MKLYEVEKRELDLCDRIRWDFLRFECTPSKLLSIATNESARDSYREMAKEAIKIMYEEAFRE